MKETLVVSRVLIVAAMTGILFMATANADIDSPKKAHDTSNTNVENNNKQSMVVSGLDVRVQNCVENNIDSSITSGDEQLDCHNDPGEEIHN